MEYISSIKGINNTGVEILKTSLWARRATRRCYERGGFPAELSRIWFYQVVKERQIEEITNAEEFSFSNASFTLSL